MGQSLIETETEVIDEVHGKAFSLYHGDCCELIKGLDDNSIHYVWTSLPFLSIFVYSSSDRDMGNCKSKDEFWEHFRYLTDELYRVMKPGRVCSIHCMNVPTSKQNHGFIGIQDFRGDIIRDFQRAGFIFHSEAVIHRDPVVDMQRTKALGLLHKQVKKNSCMSRNGIPDTVLQFAKEYVADEIDGDATTALMRLMNDVLPSSQLSFRKDGENEEPVTGEFETFYGDPTMFENTGNKSIDIWQRYADPIWMDIRRNRTIQFKSAKSEDDGRHVCLAKGCLILTKNRGHVAIEDIEPGDLVLTHMGRWRPVISKHKTSDSAPVVNVNAQGVSGLVVTPTHKVWCKHGTTFARKKDKAKTLAADWFEAKDLEGGYVNLKLPPVEEDGTSERDWWIVGRWIAKLEKAREMIGDRLGGEYERDAVQVRILDPDNELKPIISRCGKGAENKKLPPEAFTLPNEKASALLSGYLSGDGSYDDKRKRWYISSISRELLVGLQYLILRVHGAVACIGKGRPERTSEILGRPVNCKQEWFLSFNTENYTFSFVDDEGGWRKVSAIEDAGVSETWNLKVEEDASYTAEGVVVKNCPAQLDAIERSMDMFSNEGDTVLDPFNGVGSTGDCALRMNRKYIGFELKDSYFKQAVANLRGCERVEKQAELNLDWGN